MKTYRLLIPAQTRSFVGKRWVFITLRTLHLIGVAGLGGGFLYASPKPLWVPYLTLTLASGIAILSLEIWSNGIYLIQLRGVAVVIKLLLLLLMPWLPALAMQIFIGVIVTVVAIFVISGDVLER